MHECPDCGMVCCCDIEDIWWENYTDCVHQCNDRDLEDEDDYDDEAICPHGHSFTAGEACSICDAPVENPPF